MLKTFAGLVTAAALIGAAAPASALTMQECSAKYTAAKKDKSLGGKTWNDFRKSECGQEAAATPPAAPAAPPATAEAKPATKPDAKMTAAPKTAATAPAAPVGDAKYPSAVDPKYAKETPSQARMHSCLDQYKTNKTANANGGMKWIEKGGGYYSECNKRLKGSA